MFLAGVVLAFCLTVQWSLRPPQSMGAGGSPVTGGSKNQPGKSPSAKLPDILVVDDFNEGQPVNCLGGDAGAWGLDSLDNNQYCKARIESGQPRAQGGRYLRLDYSVDSPKRAASGYWSQLKGLDARKYDHLEFWVRGDPSGGFSTKFKVEIKKPKKDEDGKVIEGESLTGSYIVDNVTDQWQKVSIPLNVMNGILEWNDLSELVIVFKDRMMTSKRGAVCLDDIAFVKTGNRGPSIRDDVNRFIEKGIRGMDGAQAAAYLVEKRLGGFPKQGIVKKEFSADDREFLMSVARDTWRFFEYFTDRHSGLPLDTIKLSSDGRFSNETFIGDYTNVTNIGLYLMVVVSACDFGFITPQEAQAKLKLTMESLARMETARGFHYNYYDTTTLERTSNFLSFVDSGWLVIGIYIVRNAFPELAGQANALIDKMNFGFFYDEVEQQMYHGYYTNIKYFAEYHYGIFYTEPRAISYMAIARGDVPLEHWFQLVRTFPLDCAWQRQKPQHRVEKEVLGQKFFGGYYQSGDLRYVPSWGGSMFEALMPALALKEKGLARDGLGANDQRHVRVQIKEAAEKLKYPVWGMSPSSVPGEGYCEFGVYDLGSKGYKPGVVTPHATFLALEFAPHEALENLRTMLERYDVYGECGFYDAVDPVTGKVAYKYLCLDQAMSFIALNNYLNHGAIRNRFHSDPMFKKMESLLMEENFFN